MVAALVARWPALPWVAPFAVFMLLLAGLPALGVPEPWQGALRLGVPALVLLTLSRAPLASLRVTRPVASTLLGLAVFLVWVLPDQLVPGWRGHWLFTNPLTGGPPAADGAAPAVLHDPWQLGLRVVRAAVLVPVVEELFWRSFLMRWLQQPVFEGVDPRRVGVRAVVLSTFVFMLAHTLWLAAIVAGLAYALLYRATGRLWTAVIAHAVTNGALGVWVVSQRQWAFW